jgi:hypothetical protein
MDRRKYLAVSAGMLSVAGCTGIQDETITMLAVNQDDTSHVVTVWAVRHEKLTVANTVEVSSEEVAQLGEMAWKDGQYRVTVQVDGDVVLANEFRSEDWFNQLDVFIDEDGTVELDKARAA